MATQKKGKDHALQTLYPHLLETVSIQDIQIPMRDGHVNDLKVYKPTDLKPSESLPVFFSNHGGGFVVGNTETEDLINRQLTHECRLVIFSLDYRLSPEHPTIPTIFNDAEDGLKWVYEHAPEYDGDMTKGLLTGGTSVGGLMASMLAFRSAKLGIPVTGTLMRQGAVMMPFVAKEEWKPRLKSMEENADAPLFNTKIAVDMYKLMTFPEGSLTDPWNFPVFASEEELARHPPIFITGAGCDPIIDDLYLFKDLLEKAGVPVQLKVHEGVPHGFHGFHMLKAAKEEMQDTPAGVKWLLGFSRGAVA
ncbi:Alpha/Beta hydrolase protein [Dactylonectria estremocensis]|uniref:Alpha/Beta hydrolase protein n=1 Tax=Dactylonectria estremocensis TaxID=1079267 RepID=A0A9P9ISM4_9HYPO|nr:Alpha/Beta hydrolase protein [Dactylonectria estremocensis]